MSNDPVLLEDHLLASYMMPALAAGEFSIAVQPQVCLQSGAPAGGEVLARWTSPILGPVRPDLFVAAAESHGLISDLGERILRQALALASRLLPANIPLSVNVSPEQLVRSDFLRVVNDLVQGAGVPPTAIEFEVTETATTRDTRRELDVIWHLKAFGFRVSLDDFGTGYSTLGKLRETPFDAVKLDKSLVDHILTCSDALFVARTAIDLAHGLEMTVVGEGVETREQADMLRQLGCEKGQGYLFARPLAPDAFQAWFAERGGSAALALGMPHQKQ